MKKIAEWHAQIAGEMQAERGGQNDSRKSIPHPETAICMQVYEAVVPFAVKTYVPFQPDGKGRFIAITQKRRQQNRSPDGKPNISKDRNNLVSVQYKCEQAISGQCQDDEFSFQKSPVLRSIHLGWATTKSRTEVDELQSLGEVLGEEEFDADEQEGEYDYDEKRYADGGQVCWLQRKSRKKITARKF